MNDDFINKLQGVVKGEIDQSDEIKNKFSHDASIFEVKPSCVISPLDEDDVQSLVKFINSTRKTYPELSLTARSAGSDMGGGPLSESIVLAFTPHFNRVYPVVENTIRVQPGVYYRDLEKITLESGLIFPAYPASREFCGLGGMIGNNCGGEKSLEYGKADRYVQKLKVVMADGNLYELKKLNKSELSDKLKLENFEGDFYRKIFKLITDNFNEIEKAKPVVTKNSAGYALWDVYDKSSGDFDLTKLFVGSQGTLGVITEATLSLVPVRKYTELMVAYMDEKDVSNLGKIINEVLVTRPESFETYDDKTLKLALKYFPEFSEKLGTNNIVSTAIKFLPEIILSLTNKLPKLMLLIEFTGDDQVELRNKISLLGTKLGAHGLKTKYIDNPTDAKKYWLIRRESFKLLKEKVKDKYASPFIDDIVVNPEYLSEFLPRFNALIDKYPNIISTVAGHIGEGNFHIIPLVDLKNENDRKTIVELGREVYKLVFEYHGTTNGEHNDGIIRTPYLKEMFGENIYKLFLEVKNIFDPDNIFNPGKKTTSSFEYLEKHIKTSW